MAKFELNHGDKFAILAIENVYAKLPKNCEEQLSNGTWVLNHIPVDIEANWKEWLGSMRLEEIGMSNAVLIRSNPSSNPQILDDDHEALAKDLTETFSLLQLSGVLEDDGASLVKGSVARESEIRQVSDLPRYKQTKGYTRTPVTIEVLEGAAQRRVALDEIHTTHSEFKRFIRGLNVLMDGFQQLMPQERLHQFVRSLEALILPEIGKTPKQFVHRCQTFAEANAAASKVLEEAFDMRSEAEHLNDWENSLQAYPPGEREDIAFQRTRQMERLACVAYSRILDDHAIRSHFRNESTLGDFWKIKDDASRKQFWGSQLDLTSIALIKEYDDQGRARR
jgi:hypothetical protein